MKFLYSHRTRAGDGQWVHISALTAALRARGHDIVMSGPGGARGRKLEAGEGSGLKSLLPAPVYEAAEYAYSFPACARLASAARANAPDILYERYNLFYHAGAWLAQRSGVPLMLEVNAPLAQERAAHGNLALKNFAVRSEAAIWCAADKVLPVTNALADIVRAAGVPDDRIEVIANGVDDAFLAFADPGPVRARYGLQEKLVLGFSGFVRDWHGVDRVLRFIASSGRSDLHLLLVGDGPARGDLEVLAGRLGIRDRLTVTGVVQRAEMPAHVAAFDIALQPAVVPYASPLKLFEYMAQARPIIAPDAPNIREVLTGGENALLFSNDGFEKALAGMIEDASLRDRLGMNARNTLIARDYTWAGNARRVEAIAEELLRKR
ncbi:MAG: glycosyltransferase family 4 protein [Parvularculaceae bacterium]